MSDLRNHLCQRSESWIEYDARGIPLARVCAKCQTAKLSKFRADVLTDPSYETYGEPIEEENW